MDSDHFPIQILFDKPLKRNTSLTEPRYRFDKTDDDLFHNTLEDSLTSVDTSTPKTYSRNNPKSSISQAILDLIKDKT